MVMKFMKGCIIRQRFYNCKKNNWPKCTKPKGRRKRRVGRKRAGPTNIWKIMCLSMNGWIGKSGKANKSTKFTNNVQN